jgi:4-amino-4-deoxy-L-arabinose transferase-like glycosyltransferase
MIFARLGGLPLRDPDEGRNSQIAREMAQNHSWLTPTYLRIPYLEKPAFFYKTVSLSMQLFGENETAARLPSAIFGAAILLMIYRFCRREYESNTAALAVIIVATSPLFLALSRHVIFDMTLAFFVCAAIFAGYYAEGTEGARPRNLYFLGAAASGFATLVKGPVGFIVPALVLAIFNIAEKRAGWWKRFFHPLNIVIFLAIVLPWFIGVCLQHPLFARYGLLEESLNRFATKSFRRSAPFYYYAIVILGGLFAWSLVLPESIRAAWRRRAQWTRADRLLIIWSLVVVIFFSLSKSKLPHYILTALVALGILTARLFAFALANKTGLAARIVFRSLIFLAILSVALAAFLLFNATYPDAIFKLKSKELASVSLIFVPAAILLLIIAAFAIVSRYTRDLRLTFATFLILPICIVSVGFGTIGRYSEATSSRELAHKIPPVQSDATIALYQSFAYGLPFYLKRPIHLITADASELSANYLQYLRRQSNFWPNSLIALRDADQWLAQQTRPVYLIAKENHKEELAAVASTRNQTISQIIPGWWGVLIFPSQALSH